MSARRLASWTDGKMEKRPSMRVMITMRPAHDAG